MLEKVCQYFYHKLRCDEAVKRGAEALPEFPITPDIVLPLLMVRVLVGAFSLACQLTSQTRYFSLGE